MNTNTRKAVTLGTLGLIGGSLGAFAWHAVVRRVGDGGVAGTERWQHRASPVERASVSAAGGWIEQRGVDLMRWPLWLVRAAPARMRRLGATLRSGLTGLAAFLAKSRKGREAGNARATGVVSHGRLSSIGLGLSVLSAQIFDLIGGPEALEVMIRSLAHATPLTGQEDAAGRSLLGADALQWHEVRIAQGGILALAFATNRQRAFTLWHTINLPTSGSHARDHLPIVMHELVHVYQYEKVGSAYLPQALSAQRSAAGYGYGLAAGLENDRAAGVAYRHYNREQQAQIVQDYFGLLRTVAETQGDEERRQQALACYADCIAEMRAGQI